MRNTSPSRMPSARTPKRNRQTPRAPKPAISRIGADLLGRATSSAGGAPAVPASDGSRGFGWAVIGAAAGARPDPGSCRGGRGWRRPTGVVGRLATVAVSTTGQEHVDAEDAGSG